LKWVGGGRMENMYQEMVYYNRIHVKTRLSQSILSKIVGQVVNCNASFDCLEVKILIANK
jgi:hypothetical protein